MGAALDSFQKQLGYQLDPFQIAACECLESNRSVLVAAPTGSGKTTIAEFAVALARRESDRQVIYTAPIKALSNQKYAELCGVYGKDQVGLLTGDVTLNADAPIRVMTTEVLRNIIYATPERLADLAFVILDEVHFLGDQFRGPVWEEILLHLPQHIAVVGLSATVSNAEELGDWIHTVRGDTEVIISERRPVPLYQHVLTPDSLLPLHVRGEFNRELLSLKSGRSRARGRQPGRKRVSRADIVQSLDETGLTPAIVFIFSRNGCDQAVSQCLFEGLSLTTMEERRQIRRVGEAAVAGLSSEDQRVLRVRTWLRGLEWGIAAHHAGMLPAMKTAVEQLFQQRLVKIVFATETLALGINMPAKAVAIEKLVKFNGESRVPLSSGEYTQLTGRAGRRGIDTEGHAVVVWEDGIDLDTLEGLAGNRSYPVMSSFKPTYNMAVNLLQTRSVGQVRSTLERSFAQFQADRAVVDVANEVASAKRSLASYERAIAAAKSQSEAARWRERAKVLRKKTSGMEQKMRRQLGSIARDFGRVVDVLQARGYLRQAAISGAGDDDVLRPTAWGRGLKHVYGERALLVLECLRAGVWHSLTEQELAAIIGMLTFEPRRETGFGGHQLGKVWRQARDKTMQIWAQLDEVEFRAGLPRTAMPQDYTAWAMHDWAQHHPLGDILQGSGIGAGDFIRWVKQTADLLNQIAFAAQSLERSLEADSLNVSKVDNLGVGEKLQNETENGAEHGTKSSADGDAEESVKNAADSENDMRGVIAIGALAAGARRLIMHGIVESSVS
ncbi:MAG: DEAD/DEAH box helicase [Microbacteriaceae bacterium]|nr:DEAD/DEAH box helicase [Microbacteriaceae bacterium]